jgi:hypothetical protein
MEHYSQRSGGYAQHPGQAVGLGRVLRIPDSCVELRSNVIQLAGLPAAVVQRCLFIYFQLLM